MRICGVNVSKEELEEFIGEELKTHRFILEHVKEHVDNILDEVFDVNPEVLKREDPSTYYAIIMELARSIMVNASVYYRTMRSRVKSYKAKNT